MENLTEKVLLYQKTHNGLGEIVSALAPRVYQFPRKKMGWDEDACGDFYVFVHSRLVRLLDRFRDQGKPFESYLYAVLGWQLRNFARDRRRGERAWNVSLRLETRDEEGTESAAPDAPGPELVRIPEEIAGILKSDADRRNFLFLTLKYPHEINPESAAVLASLVGITPEKLLSLSGALREMRSRREARLETFRFRRNRAFAQIRLLENELQAEVEESRIAALREALARLRRRMRLAMQRMARVGLAPTNLEIATVLEVPKGTVDSGLYWLKRKLASVYDPDNLRSA